jgi:hypothetical protein
MIFGKCKRGSRGNVSSSSAVAYLRLSTEGKGLTKEAERGK